MKLVIAEKPSVAMALASRTICVMSWQSTCPIASTVLISFIALNTPILMHIVRIIKKSIKKAILPQLQEDGLRPLDFAPFQSRKAPAFPPGPWLIHIASP